MKIPSKLPGDLSIRGGAPTFSGGTASYHYALGGLPWLSAASPNVANYYYGDRRIKRTTAPVRKQQFDNQESPGEQSLDGFWIRSQMSFHGGAGQLYSDPGRDNPLSDVRFHRSKNVNVWERGQLSLLNRTKVQGTTTFTGVRDLCPFYTTTPSAAVGFVNATKVGYYYGAADAYSETWTADVSEPYSMVTNGSHLFVATTSGVWRAPVVANGVAFTWTKLYAATTVAPVLGWVKERLFFGADVNLYELNPFPGGALPAALPTAVHTSTATNWRWTAITETTSAIFAVGNAQSQSSILKFTLDTSVTPSVLSGGSIAATLPGGEIAVSAFGYLGNFLGLGTNKGARVGVADEQGNITYGPLLFESTSNVNDFTGRDSFLYCTYSETVETSIKLARIDLSTQIETLRFPYASDLSVEVADATKCTRVAFVPGTDDLVFSTDNNLYVEVGNQRSLTGYLYTSRIRFSTLEPKNFRNFRVRGPQLAGPLGISVVDNSGTETPVTVFGTGQTPGTNDVTLPSGPLQDFMQLKFTLNSSGLTNDTGSIMYGWQMKALPGSPRQRMIVLPLLCFDWEVDKHGQRVGGDAYAIKRLLALEGLESAGGVTTLQDLDGEIGYDVYIEGMEFVQVDPPPEFKGWGGIVTVTLRTV